MKFKITALSFVSIVIFNLSPAFSGEWTPVVAGVDSGFLGIWGSSSTDVFAVGGTIYHYNGSTWSMMQPYSDSPYHAVWGTSESDVFALQGSRIIHYDGTNWVSLYDAYTYPFDRYIELHGMWGSSNSNVYVAGGTFVWQGFGWIPIMPIILHYDGVNWTQGYTKGLVGETAEGIWGSSEDDMFAIVAGIGRSQILHYDGKSWTVMKRFPLTYLSGVWGSSGKDVFAVGFLFLENNEAVIWHYDGQQWTQMETGQNMSKFEPRAVWGSSGENVYVGGYVYIGFEEGTPFRIFHYDGRAWSAMESPLVNIESIWGSSATDIYAAGYDSNFDGVILHYDGTDGG
jgi:hypothetical protein